MQPIQCKRSRRTANPIQLLALSVLVACAAVAPAWAQYEPVENTSGFSGEITSRGNALLSVGNNLFNVDAETQWRFRNQQVSDVSLFDVGDLVLVRAVQIGESWLAREVTLVANLVRDEGVDDSITPVPTAVFAGNIAAISADSVSIQGTTLILDTKTVWRANGSVTADRDMFDAGDQVVAHGDFDGKVWKATLIELIVNNVADDPAPQPDPQEGDKVNVSGVIQTFAPERMVLDTETFVITEFTLWIMSDGSPGLPEMFSTGDTVQVSASRLGELWYAERITMVMDMTET